MITHGTYRNSILTRKIDGLKVLSAPDDTKNSKLPATNFSLRATRSQRCGVSWKKPEINQISSHSESFN